METGIGFWVAMIIVVILFGLVVWGVWRRNNPKLKPRKKLPGAWDHLTGDHELNNW